MPRNLQTENQKLSNDSKKIQYIDLAYKKTDRFDSSA